jgi:hypothetical protein
MVVNIDDNVLVGVVAGAITAVVIVALFAAMSAVAESFMSLGGNGRFLVKLGNGSLIYGPIGMIIGGGIAATGLPAWTAVLAVILLFLALCLGMRLKQKSHGY